MILNFKPNKSRTRTTVSELLSRGRKKRLGVIRINRGSADDVFVVARPLSAVKLESVVFWMAHN
jgi:hypothetical protein